MRIQSILISSALLFSFTVTAQEKLEYQKPPKAILDLVDVPQAPGTIIDDKGEMMVLIYRDRYKTIAEMSEEEMKLAGLRIDPKTNSQSRATYYKNIKLQKIGSKKPVQVKGLPEDGRFGNFRWSPDQSKMAFTNTTMTGVELWVMNIKSAQVKKLTDATLNANLGSPVSWFGTSNTEMLVRFLPEDRKPLIDKEEIIPQGPVVSESHGEEARNRTYQDLLEDPQDEFNFEQLIRSTIYKVNVDGTKELWAAPDMYRGFNVSPNEEYVLVTTIERPFSYLVPYYKFPQKTMIYKSDGEPLMTINEVPLIEELPKGFMAVREGKRRLYWRADKPAMLYWVEAIDGGDPAAEVEYRDQVYQLDAPFKGDPEKLVKLKDRYGGITWCNDTLALANDYWWNTRNTRTYVFNPSKNGKDPMVLFDRNYQDVYSDPGRFVTEENENDWNVLAIEGSFGFLRGAGHTKEGQFPFIDKIDLNTGETERMYQSEFTDKVESIRDAIDLEDGKFLVRLESPTEYPNYYILDLDSKEHKQITFTENPFKSIMNVDKSVITYKREDGVELTATLYLPVGYDKEKKEKMPMVMWAYPREYKDKSSASQSTANPNEFTYPYYGSMVYWVTRGYVVLDDASFPIVGEGEEEPNDSFRKQLVANAKAAIDAVDELGYIDRERVAVGGHSYGAFMTANLLTHSDLFAAGIARSGAYNRTLTPFGFQSEERSYWEAPEVYYKMSPFMHADKMKTPLLLIHGKADNNSGTYTMQSERYFNALKGLGATTRLVLLPKESHGYRAKESILHMLWEQDQWLEKYVKNKPGEPESDKPNKTD